MKQSRGLGPDLNFFHINLISDVKRTCFCLNMNWHGLQTYTANYLHKVTKQLILHEISFVLVFTGPRDRQVCVDWVTVVYGCKFVRIKWDVNVEKKVVSGWVSRVNGHSFMQILSTMLNVSAFSDGDMSIVGVRLHKGICQRKAPCKVFLVLLCDRFVWRVLTESWMLFVLEW